jgi:hypothetical protein
MAINILEIEEDANFFSWSSDKNERISEGVTLSQLA